MLKKLSIVALLGSAVLLGGCSNVTTPYENSIKSLEGQLKAKHYFNTADTKIKGIYARTKRQDYQDYLKSIKLDEQKKNLQAYRGKLESVLAEWKALEKLDKTPENKAKADNLSKKQQRLISEFNSQLATLGKNAAYVAAFDLNANLRKTENFLRISKENFVGFKKRADESKVKHPQKTKAIDGMVSAIQSDMAELEALLVDLKAFKAGEKKPDFKKEMARFDRLMSKNRPADGIAIQSKRLESLDKTYVKILKGMDAEYSVKLAGVSWDNYYDWPTETTRVLPEVSLSEARYKRIANSWTYSGSLSRAKSDASINEWTTGAIKNAFPRGDTDVELWVEDKSEVYLHKYQIITEKGVSESDWVEVDAITYHRNKQNLNKEIMSKPYGKFEDEAVLVAAAAGASLVGNPAYGQWKTDPKTGTTVWDWMIAWTIMNSLTDTSYNRGHYDSYNYRRDSYYRSNPRSSQPYYKRSPREQQYAASSGYIPQSGAVYKTNSTGRISNRGTSLKSNGSSMRGRGPAGGGK